MDLKTRMRLPELFMQYLQVVPPEVCSSVQAGSDGGSPAPLLAPQSYADMEVHAQEGSRFPPAAHLERTLGLQL